MWCGTSLYCVGAEVPDEQAHRVAARRSCGWSSGDGAAARPGCGRSRRCRRWTPRCRPRCARRWPASTPVARPWSTSMRFTSALQRSVPPCPSQQLGQALHQRAGAAHRPVHAPLALQRVDQAVDAGDGERVAADQQLCRLMAMRSLGCFKWLATILRAGCASRACGRWPALALSRSPTVSKALAPSASKPRR
jgi:hypothetical protein